MADTDGVVRPRVAAPRLAALPPQQPRSTQDDPVTGALRREHWLVPVHGLTPADPDGTVEAIAQRDGTVILHLTWGESQVRLRLDVCQAAQLCTGIWEAAGVAQQLTAYLDGDQPALPPPPHGSANLPPAWRAPSSASAQDRSPRPRRKLHALNNGATMETTRTIGLRIRRIRKARGKSIRVLSGLAGMSRSTLDRIERGQRELTLSEIMALANALQIEPAKLTTSTILTA